MEKLRAVEKMRGFTVLLFLFFCAKGMGQSGDLTAETLVKMGYENVRWTEDDGERVYVIQNSAYRLNGVGIRKALEQIEEKGFPSGKSCRLIVLDNNVPVLSLYRPAAGKDPVAQTSFQDWNVSYDLAESWKKVKKEKELNSSLFKVDILVYPELSFKNLIITQIYQVLFDLSPAVEVSLWKGMKLTAQVKIPVYNDGYGPLNSKVRPGFVTVAQQFRLPFNLFGTATVGLFNSDRFGGDLKLVHPFKNEHFSVEGRIGLTAGYYWDGFKFHYGTKTRLTWSLGGNYYWPRFNVQFNLKAEQYLLGEKGVRFEMIRHFRYCSVGFYAMKAQRANMNGGFRFQVALPPYNYKRRKYYPRVEPSKNMGIAYNAGNEQYYYKMYRANASDNIMNENSFNPYFIKSELLNY